MKVNDIFTIDFMYLFSYLDSSSVENYDYYLKTVVFKKVAS